MLEHKLLDAELFGHTTQRDGLDKLLRSDRYRTEAVDEALSVLVKLAFVTEFVQFLVKQQPLTYVAHVAVRYKHLQISLYDAFLHVLLGFRGLALEQLGKVVLLKFLYRLVKNLVVHIIPNLTDEAALLGSENIAGATDI